MNLLNRLRHNAPLRRLLLLPVATRQEPDSAGTVTNTFDPFAYFPGRTRAWGIVQGRRGEVLRRFEVTINGRTEDGTLILDEQFRYADGERHARTWRIMRDERGRLSGTADDIVGVAKGTTDDNSMHWRYAMHIEVRGRRHRVHFDDRMWQLDPYVLVNRSTIHKFGFQVAEVTIFMQKESARTGLSTERGGRKSHRAADCLPT
ncbi:MAG: DUF3833 family protein [Gammaproteobacteria bacterium]|jgi:hypothetical protein